MGSKDYELGDTELEVLNHVWELKQASVADVLERIQEYRPLAYTTVMTILQKLDRKGYLEHHKEGKAFIYTPAETRARVRKGMASRFVDNVFGGSPFSLVQTLVKQERLSSAELEELDRLITRLKNQAQADK